MKSLVLLFTLALHATGLWPRLSAHAHTALTNAAIGHTEASPTVYTAPPNPGPIPVQTGTASLRVPTGAAYAVDATTGTVLFSQNATDSHPIASITKLATALVILSRHSLTDKVTVPKLPDYDPADALAGVLPGEVYTVGDLVTAALVPSGDDAADALALWDAGSSPKFSAEMNAKMKQWGIDGTRFSSPSGLQDNNNYATAQAVAKIGSLILANPFARQTVTKQTAYVTSLGGRTLTLPTTNQLLAGGQFYGIKTGYTPRAGECFVGLTHVQGHEVITVVLDAGDRFAATQTLTDWISSNWQWL